MYNAQKTQKKFLACICFAFHAENIQAILLSNLHLIYSL